jgi:hypothetical protein
MELELHPAVSLVPQTFNALLAPPEMLAGSMNCHLNLQRFKTLYVTGNYSRILSRLDRRFTDLDVRRAFTVFQLMTILGENHHTLLVVEHDPLLYEDASEMTEYVSGVLKETAKAATVLLYAAASDSYFEELIKNADRVFCFHERTETPTKRAAKADSKMPVSQTTLEAF